MQRKFRHVIHDRPGIVPFPPHWSLDVLLECDRAVRVLASAFKNQSLCLIFPSTLRNTHDWIVKTTWDIDRYCDFLGTKQSGQNAKVEDELLKKFPPLFRPNKLLEEPALITDMHGVGMLWFLPGLLTETRHDQLWSAVPVLTPHLKIVKSGNWRVGPNFFKPRQECTMKPGCVSLAPAWFHQGYAVSVLFCSVSIFLSSEDR